MKFENTEVWGFKHALRGMRNKVGGVQTATFPTNAIAQTTQYPDVSPANGLTVLAKSVCRLSVPMI